MLQVTPQERLALGVTALLLAAGGAVRLAALDEPPAEWQQNGGAAADTGGEMELAALRAATDSAVARERVRKTPLAEGERIDPNTATAEEIDRLPRVGPALAERIVEWRESRGRFTTLGDLDAVPGVGPALLEQAAPHLALRPGPASAAPARGERGGGEATLDLNRATAGELDALPGIGPVIARRIVESREREGRFRTLEELDRVAGVGPALRERIGRQVHVAP